MSHSAGGAPTPPWVVLGATVVIAWAVGGVTGFVFGDRRGQALHLAEHQAELEAERQRVLAAEQQRDELAGRQKDLEGKLADATGERKDLEESVKDVAARVISARDAEAQAKAAVAKLEARVREAERAEEKKREKERDADKAREIRGKANQVVLSMNNFLPLKLAEALKVQADRLGCPVENLFAFAKAAGYCDPKLDGTRRLPVPDLLRETERNQVIIAARYGMAEQLLAWQMFDPELKFLIIPDERDELIIQRCKSQFECAIDVLEYADGKKLFAGLPYEADPAVGLKKLKARYAELKQGPLK
jgi:hypothetical protein